MLLLLLNYDRWLFDELMVSKEKIAEYAVSLYTDSWQLRLGDLFEVRYGLMEQRYGKYPKGEDGSEVLFVRPSMLRPEDDTLKSQPEIEEILAGKLLSDKFPDPAKQIIVPVKHYLNEDDLLIPTKGEPRLIDLAMSAKSHDGKFVASHHFIVLRPKNNIMENLGINTTYPKAYLRMLLMKVLKHKMLEKIYSNKVEIEQAKRDDNRRSISSILPALTIDEVKSIGLMVPKHQEGQMKLIERLTFIEQLKDSTEQKMEVWYSNLLKTY
jgi:hypothetical protein